MEYCQDYLSSINEVVKIISSIAIRAGLLMMLYQKMCFFSANYELSQNLIEEILSKLLDIAKPIRQVK